MNTAVTRIAQRIRERSSRRFPKLAKMLRADDVEWSRLPLNMVVVVKGTEVK